MSEQAALVGMEPLVGVALPPRPHGGHAAVDLVNLARRLHLGPSGWELLAPHVAFDARQYRRVRLFRNDHWEALLLCWLPGQATSVHDHGGGVGITLMLAGSLREERWALAGAGQPLRPVGTESLEAGLATVELAPTIHMMVNDTRAPAISLHVYSPPLSVLGAYDPALGTRWEVPVADSPDVQVGGDPSLEIT